MPHIVFGSKYAETVITATTCLQGPDVEGCGERCLGARVNYVLWNQLLSNLVLRPNAAMWECERGVAKFSHLFQKKLNYG